MVTNGTLLDEKIIHGLFDVRLDTLWISFDGADGGNFEDIRKGASFCPVISAGAVITLKKTEKIVLATPFPPVEDVSGPKELFNVRKEFVS